MTDITSDPINQLVEAQPDAQPSAGAVDESAQTPPQADANGAAAPASPAGTDLQGPGDVAGAAPPEDSEANAQQIIAQAYRSRAADDEPDGDQGQPVGSRSKSAAGETPTFEALEDKTLDQVQAVFVPPPNYTAKIDDEIRKERVFIIHGPAQSGRRTCAIHLGLSVYGEVSLNSDRHLVDVYSRYEVGLNEMKTEFERRQIDYDKLGSLRQRLLENIEKSRDHGDDSESRADRSMIIRQLDRLAVAEMGETFIDFCTERRRRARSAISFVTYSMPLRDAQALIDLLEKHEPSERTVCIIENVFKNNIEPESILPKVRDIADRKSLCLILTTSFPESRVRKDGVPVISVDVPEAGRAAFMRQVFDSHLRFYQEVRHINEQIVTLTGREQEELLNKYLEYPAHVDLFCAALSELPPEVKAKDLYELAEQSGRVDLGAARFWFKSLSDNQKLYAMLIFLFPGVSRNDLDEIYTLAVQALRNDGFAGLEDPRAIGLMDMLKIARAHNDQGMVVFNAPAFEEEVRNQIYNHHHLLWSFIREVFPKLIELYQSAEYWRLRQALGRAIGRVGVYHILKLDGILRDLAFHPAGGVVAVAGYALDEICHAGPQFYPFVTRLLRSWVDSEQADLMWAVGAAAWRIYDGLAETSAREREVQSGGQPATAALKTLWEILARFAERFMRFRDTVVIRDAQGESPQEPVDAVQMIALKLAYHQSRAADNVSCILHALRSIASNHPSDAVRSIIEWLGKGTGSQLPLLAETAGRIIFDDLSDPRNRLLKNHHEPLLDLVGPLLSADQETLQSMMGALLAWVRLDGWDEQVQRTLLRVVNRATPVERRTLRAHLSMHWMTSSSEKAHHIAQTIIARSYAMDGVPTDPPGHYYGVLVLDGSYDAGRNHLCLRAGRQLYHRLSTYMDLYVVSMGSGELLAQPGNGLHSSDLHSRHIRPRLMSPALDRLNPDRSYFVLVLTWGPIIDFDDIWHTPWRDRLIVVPVQQQVEWPAELKTVAVGRLLEEHDLCAIEEAVRTHQAQVLAGRSPAAWLAPPGAPAGAAPGGDESLQAWLASRVEQLDELASAYPAQDVAREIIYAVLSLGSSDLPGCVALIRAWLASESELLRQMGLACSKALFMVYGACQPPPLPQHEPLLELVVPLAGRGWAGAEAVLHAARRWAAHPDWAARLTAGPAGGASELAQLVDALPPADRTQVSDAIERWSQPLRGEAGEQAPRTVLNLAEQLSLRIRFGTSKELPPLPEGSSYGIIIVDVCTRSSRSRTRLAKIASLLAKRLADNYREQIHLLIYRLGEDRPAAGPGEKPATNALASAGTASRPRLIGPLLERHDLRQVSFMLLLANDGFLDQQDWHATSWNVRGRIYRDEDGKHWQAPFPVIKRQETVEDAVDYILEQLALTSKREV